MTPSELIYEIDEISDIEMSARSLFNLKEFIKLDERVRFDFIDSAISLNEDDLSYELSIAFADKQYRSALSITKCSFNEDWLLETNLDKVEDIDFVEVRPFTEEFEIASDILLNPYATYGERKYPQSVIVAFDKDLLRQ